MRADELESGQLFKFLDDSISIATWARLKPDWDAPTIVVFAVNKHFRCIRVNAETQVTPIGLSPTEYMKREINRIRPSLPPKPQSQQQQRLLPIIPYTH